MYWGVAGNVLFHADSVIYCIDIILMLCYWLLKMCCWKCCCGVILKYVTVVVLLTNCCWIITDDDMLLLILLLLYHWGCWGFDVGRGCSLLAFSLFCCLKKRIFFSNFNFSIFFYLIRCTSINFGILNSCTILFGATCFFSLTQNVHSFCWKTIHCIHQLQP